MQKEFTDIDRRKIISTIGTFAVGGIVLGGMSIPVVKNALDSSSLEIEILNTKTNIHSNHAHNGLETYIKYNGRVYHFVEQFCKDNASPQEFLEETSRHYDPYLSPDQIKKSDALELFKMIYDQAFRAPENKITKIHTTASKKLEMVTPGRYHVPVLTSYKSLDNIPKPYAEPIQLNKAKMLSA